MELLNPERLPGARGGLRATAFATRELIVSARSSSRWSRRSKSRSGISSEEKASTWCNSNCTSSVVLELTVSRSEVSTRESDSSSESCPERVDGEGRVRGTRVWSWKGVETAAERERRSRIMEEEKRRVFFDFSPIVQRESGSEKREKNSESLEFALGTENLNKGMCV